VLEYCLNAPETSTGNDGGLFAGRGGAGSVLGRGGERDGRAGFGVAGRGTEKGGEEDQSEASWHFRFPFST
jgi:hypothetical protein